MRARFLALCLAIAAAGVLAFGVAAALALRAVDFNGYKPTLEALVGDLTGREVRIEGDFAIALTPRLAVAVNGVSLANADWASEPNMVEIARVEVVVRLLPLLMGDVSVARVTLREPRVLLERDAQGRANWVLETDRDKAVEKVRTADSSMDAIELTELHVKNAHVEMRAADGRTRRLRVDSFKLEEVRNHLVVSIDAALGEQSIRVRGRTDKLTTALANEPFHFDLVTSVEGAELELAGSIARPADAQGLEVAVRGNAESLVAVAALTGAELPPIAPVKVGARVKQQAEGGEIRISDLNLEFAGMSVTGALALDRDRARPRITGKLHTPALDARGFGREGANAATDDDSSETPGDGRVFSAEPLPIEPLGRIDLDLELEADRIRLGNVELGATRLHASLEEGLLHIEGFETSLAGGKLTGQLDLDSVLTPPSLEIRAHARDVDLGNLVLEASGQELVDGGKTHARVDVRARGRSPRELAASANGAVFAEAGEGVLHDAALDGYGENLFVRVVRTVNPTAKGRASPKLICAVVGYRLENGIAQSDRGVAVESDRLIVISSGTIDLRTEELDIGIKPHSKGRVDLSASRLGAVAYIGGTLAEPRLALDVQGAAREAAGLGLMFATAGVSLLAESFLRDKDPCETARLVAEGKAKKSTRPGLENRMRDRMSTE